MINSTVAEPSGFNSCKGVIEMGSGFGLAQTDRKTD